MLISITMFSCTKQLDTSAVSTSVSSDATVHNKFEATYILDGVGYYDCTEEGVYVTGEIKFRNGYTTKGTVTNAITTSHFRNVKGVGVETNNNYVLTSHYVDKASVTADSDGSYRTRIKFTLKCIETGVSLLIIENIVYTIDFTSNTYDIIKHDFVYECNLYN
jgi:hypothetical protein